MFYSTLCIPPENRCPCQYSLFNFEIILNVNKVFTQEYSQGKNNVTAYKKCEYWHLGCWYIGIRTIAPRGKLPPVRDGVWVNVRVSFRVLGQPDNCSRGRLPPVRVRVWVRVSFEVVGQFSSGAIVLEPVNQIRSLYEVLKLKQNFKVFPGKIPLFVIGTLA